MLAWLHFGPQKTLFSCDFFCFYVSESLFYFFHMGVTLRWGPLHDNNIDASVRGVERPRLSRHENLEDCVGFVFFLLFFFCYNSSEKQKKENNGWAREGNNINVQYRCSMKSKVANYVWVGEFSSVAGEYYKHTLHFMTLLSFW